MGMSSTTPAGPQQGSGTLLQAYTGLGYRDGTSWPCCYPWLLVSTMGSLFAHQLARPPAFPHDFLGLVFQFRWVLFTHRCVCGLSRRLYGIAEKWHFIALFYCNILLTLLCHFIFINGVFIVNLNLFSPLWFSFTLFFLRLPITPECFSIRRRRLETASLSMARKCQLEVGKFSCLIASQLVFMYMIKSLGWELYTN